MTETTQPHVDTHSTPVGHPAIPHPKKPRGFAAMDKERQRQIAQKGGRAAHERGTAHQFTSDEARRAGRKGGEIVSRDHAHMAAIGKKGGEARKRKREMQKIVAPEIQSKVEAATIPQLSASSTPANIEVIRTEKEKIESERSIEGEKKAS